MASTLAWRLEAATHDLPLVGHLFSCDWNGVRVDRPVLLRGLATAGLASSAPPPISYQVSLGRAIRAWLRERAAAGERPGPGNAGGLVAEDAPGSGEATRSLVRVARARASDWILFGVVQEAVDLIALGLDYTTELRVLVHKTSGRLLVTTEAAGTIDDQRQAPPAAQRIARQLLPHWEEAQRLHTAGDLGEMTRASLRAGLDAVAVREGSGWYFVPFARQAGLRELRDLIDGLPTVGAARPFALMLGQIDTVATRKQLARAAYEDFITHLEAARQDLVAFAAKPDGTVRAATIAARLTAYKALKQRASLYADLLGMQQEALQRQLTELTAQAQAIVTHVGGAAPTAISLPLPGLGMPAGNEA